jgi:hypothetical protein
MSTKKQLEVPKGSNIVSISVTGHSYVRLLDAKGDETFRFDSPAEHVTAAVGPGTYTIDTDGKLGKTELSSFDFKSRGSGQADATKPPKPRG